MTTDRIEQAAPDVREVGLYGPNGLLARFTEMAGAIKKSAEECKAIGTSTSQAATIAALQSELADAREVPGRIASWLRSGEAFAWTDEEIAIAIEARDWSKP